MSDEFDGVGGSYTVDANGKRTQSEAPTQNHPDGNKAREAEVVVDAKLAKKLASSGMPAPTE